MFNEGFVSSTGPTQDRDLAADAVWLAGVVATSLPHEARGLGARRAAHDPARPQPRTLRPRTAGWCCCATRTASLWDADGHRRGRAAARARRRPARPGRYQLQAAIAACHATSPSWEETDWLQIVTLYELLLRIDPSPVVAAQPRGRPRPARPEQAAVALAEVDELADRLAAYHLFHATRAELLTALGRDRRGSRRRTSGPGADHQRRRATAARHPAAPPPAGRRLLSVRPRPGRPRAAA